MTDYDELYNKIRGRMGKQTPEPAPRGKSYRFELCSEATRKDGKEILQFGVDHLSEPIGWAFNVAHIDANAPGDVQPLREVWVHPTQAEALLDLLDEGFKRLQNMPARGAGSPNCREEVGNIDGPGDNQLRVVIQGYGQRWNLKIVGPGNEWLPFDGRDYGAFLDGLAQAAQKLNQLDDGIPF